MKKSNTMAPMTAALAKTAKAPQPFEVKGVPKTVHQPKGPAPNKPTHGGMPSSAGPVPPKVPYLK